MTPKVVNLRAARKAKRRDGKRAAADANALKHGRSRAERDAAGAERARLDGHLDGHKRDE